ncbi:MAG: ammonium transporter [Opitutales bacterium]
MKKLIARPSLRRFVVGFLFAASFALVFAQLGAQEADPSTPATADLEAAATAVAEAAESMETAPAQLPQLTGDILWLIIAGVLVFFMQAGFAMVETGMTRAKNSCNIMMKNIMDCSAGGLAFWAVGYCFMYGENSGGFIGWDTALLFPSTFGGADGFKGAADWFFQVVFAATAATIVAGAVAERTKFIAYLIYSVVITAIIYPIAGGWIWGGGANAWLGNMGIRDFAGSTVVHSVGAWAGLAGAMVLGPRRGKYDEVGNPLPIPGHNLPLAALGMFILWFGWFGFNAGSTLAAADGLAHIAVTTFLAACAGGLMSTLTTWVKFGKPDLTMTINGVLAGLVGITAPCASVNFWSAVVIGGIAGVLVVFSVLFIERTLKVDDPVGAVSVHGVCGAWGTLSVGLFGSAAIDTAIWGEDGAITSGLFMGGGFEQFVPQLVGVLAVFAFVFATAYGLFYLLKVSVGLRVDPEEELEGLDVGEHGNEAYADFQVFADEA